MLIEIVKYTILADIVAAKRCQPGIYGFQRSAHMHRCRLCLFAPFIENDSLYATCDLSPCHERQELMVSLPGLPDGVAEPCAGQPAVLAGHRPGCPIFDADRLATNRDLAMAQREELLLAYRQSIVQAFSDVQTALNAVAGVQLQAPGGGWGQVQGSSASGR
jgi:hypothetical protein